MSMSNPQYLQQLPGVSAGEIAKNVATLFFGMILLLFGMIFFTFLLCMIFDKCCNCFSPELHNDSPRVIAGGIVARDAGLTGLTGTERRNIFKISLSSKLYSSTLLYQEQKNDTTTGCSFELPLLLDSKDDKRDEDGGCDNEEPTKDERTHDNNVATDGVAIDDSNGIMCAICLDEYDEKDEIIEGKYCSHIFHQHCLLDWLEKHDDCPCCRVTMISSEEMQNAAKIILEPTRLQDLIMGYDVTRNIDDELDFVIDAFEMEEEEEEDDDDDDDTTDTENIVSNGNNAINPSIAMQDLSTPLLAA